ncbi:hypothetical protein ACR78J_21855, partial [Sphingobacterium spiritivorum]|uniref:hypothetical protein n=1 Tax=Sphingobacterium spiritivorum TaxID=258 RepID=UPI003DA64856
MTTVNRTVLLSFLRRDPDISGERLRTNILNVSFYYLIDYSASMLLVRTPTDAPNAFAALDTGNTTK